MYNIKLTLIALTSVLLIACEQEDFSVNYDSSVSSTTTITLTAQPLTDEDVIALSLTTFGTESFPQGPTDSDTLIHVTTIPTPCTLWQGHVVALVEPISTITKAQPAQANVPEVSTSGSIATVLAEASVSSSRAPEASASGPYAEARILLLSESEWTDLPSALNTTNPTAALTIPTTYIEGSLKDWRIPTAAEAKALKAAYLPPALTLALSSSSIPDASGVEPASSLISLNTLLESIVAPTIQATDEKGSPIRYLCEDATHSFSFAPSTTISAAGTKATTYRLRLVKTLRLKLQQ